MQIVTQEVVQHPLLAKLDRWSKKSSAEKNRLILNKIKSVSAFPFYFGISHFLDIFTAYHPDSQATFNKHPEFYSLYKNFIKNNALNNAGDTARLWSFILNLKQIVEENIQGDFAELGVWRGNTAAVLAHFANQHQRKVYLFDTYTGFNAKDLNGVDANKKMEFNDTSVNLVKEVIGENAKTCEFVVGYFPESLKAHHSTKQYAVVSLDCDLYEPMKAGLKFFYPLMPKGGLFLLHDYSSQHWDGAKKAIDEFCRANNQYIILMPDKSGSAFIRKV